MNLCFVTKLFDDLNVTFQGHISDVARQQVLRTNTEGHVCPDLYVGAVDRQPDLLAVWQLHLYLFNGCRGHFDGQEVHLWRANEARNKAVCRVVVQLQRFTHLRHTAGIQHHDFVGEGHRFHLIVGDVNHRAAKTLVQTGDFNAHLDAQGGIQVRKRFIEQEHARFGHQRTANRHTLTLTTGKRFWFTLQQVGQL